MLWRRIACTFAMVLAVSIFTATSPASATAPSVEAQVMSMINAERTERLVVHSGLLVAARAHSWDMSREGGLSHEGADERVNTAPPDPAEGNGAPDDGFPIASWCENVTYTSIANSESEAAKQLFQQWNKGGAHHRCMMETERNVGAVGVYYDGESYWATFIAEIDTTPPGGSPPPAKPAETKPKPDDKPAAIASAAPRDVTEAADGEGTDAPPAASVVDDVTADPNEMTQDAASSSEAHAPTSPDPQREESASPEHSDGSDVTRVNVLSAPLEPVDQTFGWREIVAVVGVLLLASWILRRAIKPLPAPQFVPETTSERELIGAGASID
jgi:uncharacterized protein YkwD